MASGSQRIASQEATPMNHDPAAKDELEAGTGDCPFLQPSRPQGTHGRAVGIYCRMPGGRVRVPSVDEQRRFCLPGQWRDCSVYRRHAAR
jgi:hypothetical protein